MTDFQVSNQGTISLLILLTDSARQWADMNIGQGNGYKPLWPIIVVEHRYIDNIIEGIQSDGLVVEVQ